MKNKGPHISLYRGKKRIFLKQGNPIGIIEYWVFDWEVLGDIVLNFVETGRNFDFRWLAKSNRPYITILPPRLEFDQNFTEVGLTCLKTPPLRQSWTNFAEFGETLPK